MEKIRYCRGLRFNSAPHSPTFLISAAYGSEGGSSEKVHAFPKDSLRLNDGLASPHLHFDTRSYRG